MTNETTASQPKVAAPDEDHMDAMRELVSDFRKAAFEFGQGGNPDDHTLMMRLQQQLFVELRAVASQLKSIGDDAQFRELILRWKFADSQEEADTAYRKAIAHLDSRAPAAQASATIQAAPEAKVEVRCEQVWIVSGNDSFRLAYEAESDAAANWYAGRLREAIAPAATIQEPVMVAETVGKTAVDQYGTTRCASCDANLDINEEHSDDCSAAAPMVADPAGVPSPTLGEVFASVGGWMNGGELGYPSFGSMDALRVFTQRSIRAALAATVKAVPSEALGRKSMTPMQSEDDANAGIVRRWYFDCDGFYIDVERDDDGRFSIFIRDRNAPKGKKEGWRDQADTDRLNLIESVIKEDGYFYLHNNRARAHMGLDVRPGQLREALDALSNRRIAAPLADKTGGGE